MEYLIKIISAFVPYKKWRKKIRSELTYIFWARRVLSNCKVKRKNKFQIINHNLGEVTMFCQTYKHWYKGGIVVLTKKYHKNLFNMFLPHVPVMVCERSSLCVADKKTFIYKENVFEELLTSQELYSMNQNSKKFIDKWQEHLNTDLSELMLTKPILDDVTKVNASKKLKYMGLDINNLIFVASEAQSALPLSDVFWNNLVECLRAREHSVFFNKAKGNENEVLTIEEATYVASKSKLIIGLRSGLMDLFCMLGVPMAVIYTDNSPREDIQPTYTLKQYPYCTKDIIEYNMRVLKEKEVIDSIIKKLEKL